VPTNHDATRAQLETERAQLLRRIDELTVGGEVDLDYADDFADRGQVTGEKGENSRVAEVLQKQLGQVDRALASIEGGTYGVCSVCGRDIEADRLEALPATDRCITHA
jgi:RNA polymerase-binding transcription factor DksA